MYILTYSTEERVHVRDAFIDKNVQSYHFSKTSAENTRSKYLMSLKNAGLRRQYDLMVKQVSIGPNIIKEDRGGLYYSLLYDLDKIGYISFPKNPYNPKYNMIIHLHPFSTMTYESSSTVLLPESYNVDRILDFIELANSAKQSIDNLQFYLRS